MYTWVLAMVCLASFLKLNYMMKSAILLVMVTVYTILMTAAYPQVFDEIQVRSPAKRSHGGKSNFIR
jgi:hypothetical protein